MCFWSNTYSFKFASVLCQSFLYSKVFILPLIRFLSFFASLLQVYESDEVRFLKKKRHHGQKKIQSSRFWDLVRRMGGHKLPDAPGSGCQGNSVIPIFGPCAANGGHNNAGAAQGRGAAGAQNQGQHAGNQIPKHVEGI